MTTRKLDRILGDMLDACLMDDKAKYNECFNILGVAKSIGWMTRKDYNAGLRRLRRARPEDIKKMEKLDKKEAKGKCAWRLHNDGRAFICMTHGVVFDRTRDVPFPDTTCSVEQAKRIMQEALKKVARLGVEVGHAVYHPHDRWSGVLTQKNLEFQEVKRERRRSYQGTRTARKRIAG